MRAVQTTWDRDRGVPCKQHGIAIEVWRGNNMGSRLKCVMQTVWDRSSMMVFLTPPKMSRFGAHSDWLKFEMERSDWSCAYCR